MWFVYVIQCVDGSFYTGSTNNLKKRFLEHKNGVGGRYTRSHKPVKIIYFEKLPTRSKALKREAQIKSWSKGKKIRMINSFLPAEQFPDKLNGLVHKVKLSQKLIPALPQA